MSFSTLLYICNSLQLPVPRAFPFPGAVCRKKQVDFEIVSYNALFFILHDCVVKGIENKTTEGTEERMRILRGINGL